MTNWNPNYEIILTSVSFTRIEIVAFSILSLAMQTHTLFRAALMHHTIPWCRCCKDAGLSNRKHFVDFGRRIFQQTTGIPMGTNCAPLLANWFLYSYEAEFIQGLMKVDKKRIVQQFNFTYRYIDDVLSLNNSKFSEYLGFIYPCKHEIKETWDDSLFLILGFISLYPQWKAHY